MESQQRGEGAISTLLRGVEHAQRQLSEKEEELREVRQAIKSGSVGGSGSTDQQLVAAEQELTEVWKRV